MICSTVDAMSFRTGLARTLELDRGGASNSATMEGLRGVAIGLVFCVHYAGALNDWIAPGTPLQTVVDIMAVGGFGVDLFFVLSGYLIYGLVVSRPHSLRSYFSRRFWRIYPTFAVALALAVVAAGVTKSPFALPTNPIELVTVLIANALLLPGILPFEPIMTVAWSLSFEVAAYILFPLGVTWLNLRERSRAYRVRVLGAVWLIHLLMTVPFGLAPRMSAIFGGAILWEYIHDRHILIRGWMRWGAPVVVIAAIAVGYVVPASLSPLAVTAGFVALVTVAFNDDRWLRSALSWTPLRWFGNMSYSYYLFHAMVLAGARWAAAQVWPPSVTEPFTHEPWAFFVLLLPAFGLTVACSYAVFVLVERPISLVPDKGAAVVRLLNRFRIAVPRASS